MQTDFEQAFSRILLCCLHACVSKNFSLSLTFSFLIFNGTYTEANVRRWWKVNIYEHLEEHNRKRVAMLFELLATP